MKYCTNCGMNIGSDEKRCPECGTDAKDKFLENKNSKSEFNSPTNIDEIVAKMSQKTTDELLEILNQNNSDKWTDDAFLAIKVILRKRGIDIPEVSNSMQTKESVDTVKEEADEDVDNYFEAACTKYVVRQFDDAKRLFNKEIDSNPESVEAKTSRVQLKFLKKNPWPWIPLQIFVFFFIIGIALRGSRDIIDYAEIGPYFLIGILSIYWIYHSLSWPIVFQAKQRFDSALGWLGFMAMSNLIIGFLETFEIVQIFEIEPNTAKLILIFGLITLVVGILASKLHPRVGQVGFLVIAIAWAIDTAAILSVVALSFVSNRVQVEFITYIWAIAHLIALSSLIRGMGGAKALIELGKTDIEIQLDQNLEPEEPIKVPSRKKLIFVKGYMIVMGVALTIWGFFIAIDTNFENLGTPILFFVIGSGCAILGVRFSAKHMNESRQGK